jgi:hypothetical protein
VFCRLKDFRRIATRYDKLARNFASAPALAGAGAGNDHADALLAQILAQPVGIVALVGDQDVKTAPAVLDKAPGRVRRLIADKGYDADWLRQDLRKLVVASGDATEILEAAEHRLDPPAIAIAPLVKALSLGVFIAFWC